MSNITKYPHPGGVLLREFLRPLKISQYRFAKETGISHSSMTLIIKGKRSISAENALRIAKALGTTPELWLNMQRTYDLRKAFSEHKEELEKIHTLVA